MGIEIERKFLVKGDRWRPLGTGELYRQGYLTAAKDGCTVRVRVAGDRGYLTVKGKTVGNQRSEFEYQIPVAEAEEMLNTLCRQPQIEKTRYKIPLGSLVWEVDEFAGENAGLIVAEVELSDPEQAIDLPEWIDQEVSTDPRYFNAYLAQVPFQRW
ncbi:MAG: CYTH domain-containing protein [Leptolyngbyaceae cyanobacterium SM1_1_3]|nr:CYTH domain-containing protein [Leptolyngbyaceae cyanobacterium SM1_1_3]NJN02956.1 CYTH domain-containing protein [Leptolyngbyaceae cyanobacterium RM1_1_2]NJO08842.1 CYTH domain-containing protein [Leptolyngbyaceae cyanobacterium SL_1_1]